MHSQRENGLKGFGMPSEMPSGRES